MEGLERQPTPKSEKVSQEERESLAAKLAELGTTEGNNHAQRALVGVWVEGRPEEFASRNDQMLAWISSGMAAKFEMFAKRNAHREISTIDTSTLRHVIEEIEGGQMNEPTQH